MPTPTVIADLSTTIANNFPAGSNAPSVLDDVQRAHAAFIAQLRDRTATDWPNTPAGTIAATTVQGAINELGRADVIYTTAGTSTAYTLTPSPAITAYAAGQSFYVTFNAASGAAPTLAISGVATPPNLVKQLLDGTYANIAANDLPINHRSRVTLMSATQALVQLPTAALTLGVGQTWQNLTASRAAATTYTNTTGRPLFFNIRALNAVAGNFGVALLVDGLTVGETFANTPLGAGNNNFVLGAIVPAGSTYSISALSNATLQAWFELR